MSRNLVSKESTLFTIISGGNSSLSDCNLFPALKQNLRCHEFKGDRSLETGVTQVDGTTGHVAV